MADVLAGVPVPLYDQRIIDEYREVLVRSKLRIPTASAEAMRKTGAGSKNEAAGP